jgi:uncharacterized repeat protein (TIGR03803 family)
MRKLSAFVRLGFALVFCFANLNVLSAQTFTTITTFNGTNGANPGYGSLIQATNGLLFGTTTYGGSLYGGGSGCPNPYGCGTVFDANLVGKLTTIQSFSPNGGPAIPMSGLIQASDGNLYGTTIDGGTNDCGTVFKVGKGGALTTIYNFACDLNGGYPQGGLVQATNGILYGTTSSSGANSNGTVFSITGSGSLTTLYGFCSGGEGCPDGADPAASMIQASDGNLYGTTLHGAYETGTIFRMTLAGQLTTLYKFCSIGHCLDGNTPQSSLIEGPEGYLYGTTVGGGQNGAGSVYQITRSGQLTTLYSFAETDGGLPSGALVYASDGNLYGTTPSGRTGNGTIFKLTPLGTLTTLYNFCSQENCADGKGPLAGLTQDTNGNLFGTTSQGGDLNCSTGSYGCGTVFSLFAGLLAFVQPLPNLGHAGSSVVILGNGFTGATGVTFGGTPAAFSVVSGTEIKATVPNGARSGRISVTIGARTLSTVLVFTVN